MCKVILEDLLPGCRDDLSTNHYREPNMRKVAKVFLLPGSGWPLLVVEILLRWTATFDFSSVVLFVSSNVG